MEKNTRIPYGVDANPQYPPHAKDETEAWEMLDEIQLSLEKGEAVAPELARWLGNAILYSGRNQKELLRRLGLKRPQGRQAKDPDAWMAIGRRIWELEDGNGKEKALQIVQEETYDEYERSTLQRWRNKYFAAHRGATEPG